MIGTWVNTGTVIAGGLIGLAIGFNLLTQARIRIGNMVPALIFAALFAYYWK